VAPATLTLFVRCLTVDMPRIREAAVAAVFFIHDATNLSWNAVRVYLHFRHASQDCYSSYDCHTHNAIERFSGVVRESLRQMNTL